MKQKLLATTKERDRLLDALARGLAPGESILRVIDTYRVSGKVTVQAPLDAGAEVLMQEPPCLQPGGITELIGYVKVRDRMVREVTFLGAEVERDIELQLKPVRKSGAA